MNKLVMKIIGTLKKAQEKIESQDIILDGYLIDKVWTETNYLNDFIQVEPAFGNSPTKQTEVDFKNPSGTIEAIDVAYDPDSGQFGLVYKEGSTNNCHVRLGKASGNTVTFGSEVTYAGGNSNGPVTICYDTTRKKFILAAGYNGDQSNNGWGFVGTVSGTSITVTSAGLIKYNYQNKIKMIHDPFRDRDVFVGYNNNNSQWDSLTGTYVSDTEITWNDNGVIQDAGTNDRGVGLV